MKKYEEITVMKGEGVRGGFYWPSITRLSDGRLMAGSSGFRVKHICPFGEVAVNYSSDEGKTWTAPESVLNTPLDDRDAGVVEYNGKIIVTTFNNSRAYQLYKIAINAQKLTEEQKKTFIDKVLTVTYSDEAKYLGSLMFSSEDGGKTWSEPKKLPVTAPHGMIKLNDGRLFYVGRYFADALPVTKSDRKEGIAFITSTDGENFTDPQDLPLPDEKNVPGNLFCEPHAVQLKSGRILVGIRLENKNSAGVYDYKTYLCYSDDNGKTFTMPAPVTVDRKALCGAPPHLIQHSSGAVVMVYGRRKAPCGERAIVSYDDGVTWSKEYVLNEEPDPDCSDIGYPASVELNGGDIYTVYYTHRDTNSVINAVRWNLNDIK